MTQPKPWPIGAKIVVALVLGLMGLAFPLLFIPAVLVLLSIGGDGKPVARERSSSESRKHLTAAVQNWKSHWLSECESPAEEAFLNAAIDAFGLIPDQGNLRKGDVALKLQVLIQPYRVDFMVNDRLIVEVDGEAYHSAPEAVARDRERDAYMVSYGYAVLRIPAKVVLRQPSEALRRVRISLANLPPPIPPSRSLTPKQHVQETISALGGAVTSMGGALDELNRLSQERIARQRAEAAKPKPKWPEDPEFQSQLSDRIEARMEKYRAEHRRDHDLTSHLFGSMDSFAKEKIKKDEQTQLLKEWEARAAAVPADREFHRLLELRVNALCDTHGFDAHEDQICRSIPWMAAYRRDSVRAKYRWQEEARLIEEWSRRREQSIPF